VGRGVFRRGIEASMATHILGISAFYHDSAAALVRDGAIVAAAQEERFTREKHDHRFPENAIAYCLQEAGIKPSELDAVAFYDKPILKFERLLETYLAYAPRGLRSFMHAMPLWLKQKLFLPREIDRGLGNEYTGPIYFTLHHESHAASAFYPSPFEEAAIVTLDGVGEWSTTTWGSGSGNRIELKQEVRFPHSLGLLYSAFTYYLGFKVNSGEYKVMGLAPYGEPKYASKILSHLLDVQDDGSFWLDQKYFNYCAGLRMTNARFHDLFEGPPRNPETKLTQRHMDLAASVQRVTEEVMLRIAKHVHTRTGMDNLCMAGGVALNCVGNGRVLREGPFKKIWIQPAAGDAGGALGAALFTWHQIMGNARTVESPDSQHASYLGPAYQNGQVTSYLDTAGAKYTRFDDEQALCDRIAELLEAGKVVGHFAGRMEFGPRALGARSILGDARNPEMQATMNLKVKFRESFRPFAPSCLEEKAGAYFELDQESPYMLLVAPVQKDRRKAMSDDQAKLFGIDKLNVPRSDVPAITHVDYSARVQTVTEKRAPRYYRILKAFEARTGCGLLVNTSFNIRGEPIVCTPEDAYKCFMYTDMDALVLEDCICLKEEQPALPGAEEYKRSFKLD
jgi:carbamoyltransferase